jgi:glycosyltransferase involved in cell wall biosynthesis
MKILVNSLLSNGCFSGVQYATENLLQAISCRKPSVDYIETLVSKDYGGVLKEKDNFHLQDAGFSTANRGRRIFYENFRLGSYFSNNGFDLYHSAGYVLPFFSGIPSIVTIHDLIAIDFPQYCKNETALYYGLFLPRSIHKAKKIIAVSDTVKRDILRHFVLDPDKIEVIYHGVESIFRKITCEESLERVTRKYKLPPGFLLYVGNLEPKKNIRRLIEAYMELRRHAGIRQKLVIAGRKGWKYDDIFQIVKREKMEQDILFTGYVEREDLPCVYSLADLFIFPSLYEGFGLPVLEAMACELPVLISNQGALPEIAGEIYPQVDAYNVEDIAKKILVLLGDPELRAKNISYGIKRIKQFSWEKAADETLAVYKKIRQI